MLYLAEKYNKFIPTDPLLRTEMLNWLFWQVSNLGPIVGDCFGHFFCYAPGVKAYIVSVVYVHPHHPFVTIPCQMTSTRRETTPLVGTVWK
jgi:hypothetical protein